MPVIFCIIGYFVLWAALQQVWAVGQNYVTFLVSDEMPVFNATLTQSYDKEAPKTVYLDKVYYDTYLKEADGSLSLYEKQHPCEEEYLARYQADQAAGKTGEARKSAKAGDIVRGDPYMLCTDVEWPVSGDHYAQIECGRIELDAPVYWYDTPEILAAGVGQSIASKPPGYGRLVLLSAHNTSWFRCLEYIETGDVVKLDTNYCDYEYKVTDVRILNEKVLESQLAEQMMAEEEKLVMYTCYPFYVISSRKTDRLVVTAERVKGIDIKWRNME